MSRHGGEPNELMSLKKLKGQLCIENLRHWMVTKDANMKEKQHLQSFVLNWAYVATNDEHEGVDDHEDGQLSLEGFQPHPNLKQLIIKNYNGVRLSSRLPSLTNLTKLELYVTQEVQYK